jgi:antitoxin MazE
MSNVTKTRIVRIGNSRGIRIPKVWVEQLDLGEEVELSVHADRLVIRSLRRVRQGWEEKIRASLEKEGEELRDAFRLDGLQVILWCLVAFCWVELISEWSLNRAFKEIAERLAEHDPLEDDRSRKEDASPA